MNRTPCTVNHRRTLIYLRVSTTDQNFISQRAELLRFCQNRGWLDDFEVFEETASGANLGRPILQKMLQTAKLGIPVRIVCYKLDRLGRSLTHLALILEELNRDKIPLICTSQGIDTSEDHPVGRLQLGVLMAVAEFERGIIRERVYAGLAAAKQRGVRLGRPRSLEKHRSEVLARHARGLSLRQIARQLGLPVSSVYLILRPRPRRPRPTARPAGTAALSPGH